LKLKISPDRKHVEIHLSDILSTTFLEIGISKDVPLYVNGEKKANKIRITITDE